MSLVAALVPVVAELERLGIEYQIGGSVASSAHGVPRSTNDVDVVVDLRMEHVEPLCAALRSQYYADRELLTDAVKRRSCANLIHLGSGFKVDLFVRGESDYDVTAMTRIAQRAIGEGRNARQFRLATPEDVLLRKLLWYRAGDEVSDRQWGDVLGVLRLRQASLDWGYIRDWADRLGVQDLLARAEQQIARD